MDLELIETTASDINDHYQHSDESIEYVLENVLGECRGECDDEFRILQEDYNSILVDPCKCPSDSDCSACCHGGNYIRTTTGNGNTSELILNPDRKCDLIFECSSVCECRPQTCLNRLVQYGPRPNLKIIDSPQYMSKGLITTKNLPKGAFICEYAGELLTYSEARRRIAENDIERRMNYILCLREIETGSKSSRECKMTIIDPSCRGNIGRYLNHSCEPNCEIFSVRVDSPLPKIGIFSSRHISAGEELCFDYGAGTLTHTQGHTIQDQEKGIDCLCGTSNCRKFLPNAEF